ncbi:MAG TPA: type VI secretion system baseplate subunit TssF [Victivallales bacterium]|nr:type VI secretion system baseplate subunit TssF [Victivallales bacterium]
MGGEFAKANPKIAGRLNLDEFSCEDPYVERLLEGFSYLAARVHHKLDAGYPRLSQALLDNLFPDFLMPAPAMWIVKFDPDINETSLAEGVDIKRGTKLRSIPGKEVRSCQFTTSHDVTLWPIEIADARYYTDDMSYLKIDYSERSKSCLSIELNTLSDLSFSDLKMDTLDLYLRNANQQITMETYELMLSNCRQIIIQPKDRRNKGTQVVLDNSKTDLITPTGFDIDDSLYPFNARTFEGYRLFRKYFNLPQSFMFLKIRGIGDALRRIGSDKVNIIFVYDTEKPGVKGNIKKNNFSLFCTPVVNLFEKTLSRIHLNNSKSEFHIVGERTETQDFEVVKVTDVKAYKRADNKGQVFRPLYSASGFFENRSLNRGYYSLNRVARTITENEQENGTRSNYIGTETYISLVDQDEAPYNGNLAEIEIKALCSNRDLPLLIPQGNSGDTDFTFDSNLPVSKIKFLHGPTSPNCDHLFTSLWEIINHVSLNYMTLQDESGEKTGEIIRNILALYAVSDIQKKYIKGLKTIKIVPDTQRFNRNGMFTFLNGLAVDVLFDESSSSNDYFLLGMILDRFFKYSAPVNTFTKTTVKSIKRGKVIGWPARTGTFQMI